MAGLGGISAIGTDTWLMRMQTVVQRLMAALANVDIEAQKEKANVAGCV